MDQAMLTIHVLKPETSVTQQAKRTYANTT